MSTKPVKQFLTTKANTQSRSRPWWESYAQESNRYSKEQKQDRGRIFDRYGEPRNLGNKIAKGGEGIIYPLADDPQVLVKIYHSKVLNKAGKITLQDKLEKMRKVNPMLESPKFGWPRLLVFDQQGCWLGYAMRRVAGVQMQTLCQPQLIAERLPHWSRQEIIKCARSFLKLIRQAHRNNIILGDINPANLLINPETCEVYGIDCDSYQIESKEGFHPCPVGVPMLLAPELLRVDYSRTRRRREHELFSVAVMLFRMFMLGMHPYSRIYGDDPVANLKSGHYALGKGADCRLPEGPWFNIWSHLPFHMKSLFVSAFREGHNNPKARPSLQDWRIGLQKYEYFLNQGWHDPTLIPGNAKSEEYQGTRDLRYEN